MLQNETRRIAVTNEGSDPLDISFQVTSGGTWLAVEETETSPNEVAAEVTADIEDLDPGEYTGTVRIVDNDSGYSVEVPAAMALASLAVSTDRIDFGELTTEATREFTLTNSADDAVAFEITVEGSVAAWLSVSPATGTVDGRRTIEVTADPDRAEPGAYETAITIAFEDIEETILVTMQRPRPPVLRVEPNSVDYGATSTEKLVAIWNDGIGTINWRIDTNDFPAWLSLEPVGAGGIASGTVTGDETAALTMTIDRDAATPPGQVDYSYEFDVAASGDYDEDVTVSVDMTVPLIPDLVVEADGVDETGVDYVNLNIDENEVDIYLRNEGNGVLFWTIDQAELPTWIVSLEPAQGELEPGTQTTVTIVVDRTGLTYVGAQHELTIVSNDPEEEATSLLVELQVPKVIAIRTRPSAISLGPDENNDVFEVCNDGDPDTVLNFRVTSTKDWLAVFPETGQSIGVAGTIKDWQPFSVTVDRSQLEGEGASAKLIVTAFEIDDGVSVPAENIEPVEVNVSVEAAALTIETAMPRTPHPLDRALCLAHARCPVQSDPHP